MAAEGEGLECQHRDGISANLRAAESSLVRAQKRLFTVYSFRDYDAPFSL